MKKWILIIVVLAAGSWGFLRWKSNSDASAEAEAAAKRPTTAPVESKDIEFSVTVSGEITPAEMVSVRPEVNGKIKELPVDIGDRVKKGDLLFTLDDSDLRIEIASRQTEIASAELQLQKALRDFERDGKLFDEKLVSREVYDNSRTNYELAKNAIEKAERALDLAKDRLSKTRLVAPFDCTILERQFTVGQAVSGSGGFNSGTEVLQIANLGNMIIDAHVNQADVTRMRVGQEVQILVEAVAGLNVKGQVDRIAPQATIKHGIKGFAVRIVLQELDPRIQPGMTANITIPVTTAEGVLAVPLSAVFTERNDQMQRMDRFVYVKQGARFERRPVQIGVSDISFAEVLDGLQIGEVVSVEKPDPSNVVDPSVPEDQTSTARQIRLRKNG